MPTDIYKTVEYRKLLAEWKMNPPLEENIAKDYELAVALAGRMAEQEYPPAWVEDMIDRYMMRVVVWAEINGRVPQA